MATTLVHAARRTPLACVLLLLASCSESIRLGGECLDDLESCPPVQPADDDIVPPKPEAGAPDASVAIDASMRVPMDSAIVEERPAEEAGSDARFPVWGEYPAFFNPGFELRPGADYGEVTTLGTVLPGGADLSPWHTCQPIGVVMPLTAVRAEPGVQVVQPDAGAPEVVRPQDGRTLVQAPALPNVFWPLGQALEVPMVAGKRYSFAIDMRAITREADLSIQVLGGQNQCVAEQVLDESRRASPDRWETACFDFLPSEAWGRVFLQVKSSTAGGALVYDRIRPATEDICPPL
jgi:hypothetical protein